MTVTMTTSELLAATWKWDWPALAVAGAALGAYAVLARPHAWPRALCFCAAILAFVLALASPIGTHADGYLFSAHMLQHLLLVLIVPPLVLMSIDRPGSEAAAMAGKERWRVPTFVVWALGVGAMWLWHAPTLCNAAATSGFVHRVQEGSLLALGTAYWWPIVGPRRDRRLAPLPGVVYLFSGCVACTILGVAVTLSPVEVCSVYANPEDGLGILATLRGEWGFTPERDQQLGGLLMWVPACLVYLTAIMAMLRRFYRDAAVERGAPVEISR